MSAAQARGGAREGGAGSGLPPGEASVRGGAGAPGSAAGFLLDLARCVGCGACVLACRIENRLPPAVSWRRILSLNLRRNPRGPTWHLSLACHHCQAPPCAAACPSGALAKRADGVVLLHAHLCLGCRYCEMACPFGAPAFDEQAGVMTKCHLCAPRLDQGLEPACVGACPTGALRFTEDLARAPARFVAAPDLPGMADPAGAEPSLRLAPPAGRLREAALRGVRSLLAGGEAGAGAGAGEGGGPHG